MLDFNGLEFDAVSHFSQLYVPGNKKFFPDGEMLIFQLFSFLGNRKLVPEMTLHGYDNVS